MLKMLLKRIVPTVVGLLLVVLAALWLYGFLGVKCGWVGVTDYQGLNRVSLHGADAAGGVSAIMKGKVGL